MNTLTVKEALDQGYTHCGEIMNDWQSLTDLRDITEEEIKEGNWYLAEKEGKYYVTDAEKISEILADQISQEESEISGRDDDAIYDAMKSLDFSKTAAMINKKLKEFLTYYLTNIKLLQ